MSCIFGEMKGDIYRMNNIAVLMSTYNGEKYIIEQLDSILNQEKVDVELYIRDDGSTDGTINILKEYALMDNVHVSFENNVGVIRSFEKLILYAPKGYSYYAYADQDDVWYSDKLITGIQSIEEYLINNTPDKKAVLYCCNQNCVDNNGRFLYKRLPDNYDLIQPNIMDTFLDSYYSGCSMVMNKLLLDNIQYTYKIAGKSLRVLHDVWTITVAQATGCVIYDPIPKMDFRRHDNNTTTSASSPFTV